MQQQDGTYSFVTGFTPNTRLARLNNMHADLVHRAQANPERCFDQLCEQGRIQEALWLVEHLDDVSPITH